MPKLPVVICALSLVFFACSPNNVIEDASIKQYFDEHRVTGCFGQFDNTQGEFTIYNLSQFADSVYLPAHSFDIVNALIALETGILKNDSATLPGKGSYWSPFDNINQLCQADLTLSGAFRNSCVPWFQELARRIGQDTMQRWMDSLGYGSRYGRAVINRLDTFWLDNSIKITADEQLGMVKKLYFSQLPFKKWTHGQVKNMMMMAESNEFKLAYKTGIGRSEKGHNIGWVLGWIEENKHPYPFVLQVSSPDPAVDLRPIALNLLDKILRHYGFKEGKK